MADYLIYNYAFLGAQGKGLLENALELLALSSLSEKMFGYNKSGQSKIALKDLVEQMPVATIDASGSIYFMDTIMENVQDSILKKVNSLSNINKYMTATLDFDPNFSTSRNLQNSGKAKRGKKGENDPF